MIATSFKKKSSSVMPPIVSTDEIEVIKFEKKVTELLPPAKKIVS